MPLSLAEAASAGINSSASGTGLVISSTCSNCQKQCKPLRCTACKSVSYCSRKCQKQHWRSVHSKSCTREFFHHEKSSGKKKSSRSIERDVTIVNGPNGSNSSNTKPNQQGGTSVQSAVAAAQELNSILSQMPMNTMKEHFDKTMDNVTLELSASASPAKRNQNNHLEKRKKTKEDYQPKQEQRLLSRININDDDGKRYAVKRPVVKQQQQLLLPRPFGKYSVEKLVYTGSFTLTLSLPQSIQPSSKKSKEYYQQNLQIDIENLSTNVNKMSQVLDKNNHVKSIIRIKCKDYGDDRMVELALVLLPDTIVTHENDVLSSMTIYHNSDVNTNKNQQGEKESFLMFRLQYDRNEQRFMESCVDDSLSTTFSLNTPLTDKMALSRIQCRFCHLPLRNAIIENNKKHNNDVGEEKMMIGDTSSKIVEIKSVCRLPNGYWDEITDYLSCYDGVRLFLLLFAFFRIMHLICTAYMCCLLSIAKFNKLLLIWKQN